MTNPIQSHDLFVSTKGNDKWSGALAEPNATGTDGPLATITKARDVLRERKLTGRLAGATTVWLRAGRYAIAAPVTFGPDDSAPVTYASYPGEQAILDGGTRVEGWQIGQQNGRTVWVANLPDVANGQRYFRQLFVNGQRRPRARLPKVGPAPEQRQFFWMQDVPGISVDAQLFEGSDTFVTKPGDIQNWSNLHDIEVVVLHYWIEERLPIATFDPATLLVKSTHCSMFTLKDDFNKRWAKYYVENVFEALSEPGEWYLDRHTGNLTYIPMPGETPESVEVIAPSASQLLKLAGKPDQGKYVEFLRFEGLVFENADWSPVDVLPEPDTGMPAGRKYAASPQAASHVPGTLSLLGARFCAIEDCTIQHVGYYGLDLADGCTGNRIVGNTIGDIGAGGIKLNGADAHGPASHRTGNNTITDNHIYTGGRVYHSGIGIIARHSFGNTISHNHIHDFFYSGISCGWVWGYADSISHNNHIEKNHIHDLGHAWLSDMGGIYTLSVQPGTVIRGNVIHDVERANYGGWAIYPDEGSSHLIIENNICYNTNSQPFHEHYGRENIVRNNIFAFGGEGQIALSRAESHISITVEKNIIITSGQPIFVGGYASDYRQRSILSDLNLLWDVSGRAPALTKDMDLAQWQATGNDQHSIVADPRIKGLQALDFTLSEDSPALGLGFQPIDVSDVGPRPKDKRP